MQYIKHILITLLLSLNLLSLAAPVRVMAAAIPEGCPGSASPSTPPPAVCATIPPGCPGSTQQGPPAPNTECPYGAGSESDLEADCKPGLNEDGSSKELNRINCGIVGYIVDFTRVLSGLVGIVIVIMITIGGIQYAAAGPDPGAVVAARKRIINAVIALVLYIFMFSFLQWLVPGGIF